MHQLEILSKETNQLDLFVSEIKKIKNKEYEHKTT